MLRGAVTPHPTCKKHPAFPAHLPPPLLAFTAELFQQVQIGIVASLQLAAQQVCAVLFVTSSGTEILFRVAIGQDWTGSPCVGVSLFFNEILTKTTAGRGWSELFGVLA